MKTSLTRIFVFLFIFFSCNKNDNDPPIDKNFIEISINGENVTVYTEGSSSYAREDEINKEKPGIFDGIATIRTSDYTFIFAIYHYINLYDFENSHTGVYNICDTCSSASNLDAYVYLEDNTESYKLTSLMPGAQHKVDEITNMGDDIHSTYVNGSTKYKIKGELTNMTFLNNSYNSIVVSVKYEAFISLVK